MVEALLERRRIGNVVPVVVREPLRDGGVYLMTGGAGGIGLEVARYLLREHAARLILVGRRSPAEVHEPLRALEGLPGEVVYAEADVHAICDAIESRRLMVHVNIVRYNPYDPGRHGTEPPEEVIQRNARIYESRLPNARVRVIPRVGFDVAASCGMFLV